jgi:hypothetical protein
MPHIFGKFTIVGNADTHRMSLGMSKYEPL